MTLTTRRYSLTVDSFQKRIFALQITDNSFGKEKNRGHFDLMYHSSIKAWPKKIKMNIIFSVNIFATLILFL